VMSSVASMMCCWWFVCGTRMKNLLHWSTITKKTIKRICLWYDIRTRIYLQQNVSNKYHV
jgi:hypothetical protein